MAKKVVSLGSIATLVLKTGKDRKLTKEEVQQFYQRYHDSVAPHIQKIREEQRRAFEESRTVIVR